MNIDAPTLILLTSGITAISAISLAGEWWKGREAPLMAWSTAFALVAVGCALSLLRLSGSYVVGVWFTHGTLVMAHALFLRGSFALVNRQPGRWWLAGIPLWALCLGLPPDFGSAPALVFVNSATVGLYALACAVVLVRAREASGNVRILGAVFAIHAVAYAIRSALVGVQGGFVSIGRFEGFAISAMLFEGILVAVSLTVLMVCVIRERRESQLAMLAHIDPLTGAFNRRAFLAEAGHHLCPVNGRPATPVSLLLFDLDHFKALNDTYGHSLGDDVLKRFSELARCHLREGAVFARLGGEEFAALLPRTSVAQAESMGWAIVRSFARECAVVEGRTVSATVSVGACTGSAGSSRVEEMIEAADAALYDAKRRGRNQVRVAVTADNCVRKVQAPHPQESGPLSRLTA